MNWTSYSSPTPNRPATARLAVSARRRISEAVAPPSLTMKLACLSLIAAPPRRVPFRPQASMSRPAESPGGLRKKLPALGLLSG